MRAGIGLIALLMGVGLMFYLMSSSASVDVAAKKQADQAVRAISGQDKNGEIVTKSIRFEAGPKGVAVSAVTPGDAFDTRYGLKAGDVILEIGPFDTKTQASDDQTADAYLRDAYRDGRTLVVQRGGQRVTLPEPGTPAAEQATPQQQLNDVIKGIPKH